MMIQRYTLELQITEKCVMTAFDFKAKTKQECVGHYVFSQMKVLYTLTTFRTQTHKFMASRSWSHTRLTIVSFYNER